MAAKEQQVTYLVFARWSEIDQHYQLLDHADSQEAADKQADKARESGALATRVEVRALPKKKGTKDADEE